MRVLNFLQQTCLKTVLKFVIQKCKNILSSGVALLLICKDFEYKVISSFQLKSSVTCTLYIVYGDRNSSNL